MGRENAVPGAEPVESHPNSSGELGVNQTTPTPEPTPTQGESTTTSEPASTTENQPGGSPWDEWKMTPEQGAEAYKNLQRDYTGKATELKEFQTEMEQYGGYDNLMNQVKTLATDPQFTQWYQQKMAADATGASSVDDVDDEQLKALKIVDNRIDQRIKAEYEPKIQALETELAQEKMLKNVAVVREEFKDFDDFKGTMIELSKELPLEMQERATVEQLRDLYHSAVRRDGKYEEKAVEWYKSQLEAKKAQDTGVAGGVAKTTPNAQFKTLAEAWNSAKKTHNLP